MAKKNVNVKIKDEKDLKVVVIENGEVKEEQKKQDPNFKKVKVLDLSREEQKKIADLIVQKQKERQ
jgi:hypothetical protein